MLMANIVSISGRFALTQFGSFPIDCEIVNSILICIVANTQPRFQRIAELICSIGSEALKFPQNYSKSPRNEPFEARNKNMFYNIKIFF